MSSERIEHLSSIQNNPFVRQFGLPHHTISQSDAAEKEPSLPSSASSDRGDDDSVQEYHVNSGFVNKLRSKFAQLENKSHRVSLSRKSASVENLLSIGQSSKENIRGHRWPKDDANTVAEKVELRKAPAGYKPHIGRPRSFDLLENDRAEKPAFSKKKDLEGLKQKSMIRSVKPPLPKKTSAEFASKLKGYSQKMGSDSLVPKHEHHDWKVAPDVEKIGRENIVIIESEHSTDTTSDVLQREKSVEKSETPEDFTDGFRKVKPVTDMEPVRDENELPKPNTVSQFRTLFEKTGKVKGTLNVWQQPYSKKSSDSDANSPRVSSPASISPRSPLVKMNDNVFEDSAVKKLQNEPNKLTSPRNSSSLETNTPSSPRDSSLPADYAQNVDTTPVDIQKSRELFRRGSVDMDKNSRSSRNSYSEKTEEPLSPSVQNTLTPVHPLSKVFDSSKVILKKTDKPKRAKHPVSKKKVLHTISKETVELKHEMEQKSKKHTNDAVELRLKHDRRKHGIPKDVIEMKHESDQKRRESLSIENEASPSLESEKQNQANDTSDGVISEPVVKPSSKSVGKISPRKTEIFDSSNIVKKDKEPPMSPLSPVGNVPFSYVSDNVPNAVSVEVKETEKPQTTEINDNEVAMEISPVKPVKGNDKPTGLTEIKPNIEHKPKPRRFKVKEQHFMKAETVSETERTKPVANTSKDDDTPITGMSSFLANRLKKGPQDQENQLKTSSVHLANGSSPSPVPRKRQAPERPVTNGPKADVEMLTENSSAPPLPDTPEPTLPRTNIDDVIIRPSKKKTVQPATKLVFDSTKIATKRKEPPKRKPPRKTVDQLNKDVSTRNEFGIPKLDLSSITGEQQESQFQEGYIPTVIQPCPFKFIGAEIVFEKTPYKKSAAVKKVKISFDDHATTTFEYDHEDIALEKYLQDHPEEREDARRQEEETNGDIGVSAAELLTDSPRIPEPEPTMKSNTVLGTSGGGLIGYKSKIQTQEFQFGMRLEPEVEQEPEPEPEDVPDQLDLLPADETETEMFSAELDKADMLF